MKIFIKQQKVWQLKCDHCHEWWIIGDWKTASGPSAWCPHCCHIGELCPFEEENEECVKKVET